MSKELHAEIAQAKMSFKQRVRLLVAGVNESTTYDEAFSILCKVRTHEGLAYFKMIMQKFKEPPVWAGELLLEAWTSLEVHDPIDGFSTLSAYEHIEEYAEQFEKYSPLLSSSLDQFKGQGNVKLFSGATMDRASHSWTLDEKVARLFTGRVSRHRRGNGELLELTIDGDELANAACFYTNNRNEQEVYFLQDMRPKASKSTPPT